MSILTYRDLTQAIRVMLRTVFQRVFDLSPIVVERSFVADWRYVALKFCTVLSGR